MKSGCASLITVRASTAQISDSYLRRSIVAGTSARMFQVKVWGFTSSNASCKRKEAVSHTVPRRTAARGSPFIYLQHHELRADSFGRGRSQSAPHRHRSLEERRVCCRKFRRRDGGAEHGDVSALRPHHPGCHVAFAE